MQDDDAPGSARKPTRTGGPAPEDEVSVELSRAAREAVRQPPDPRLEKQFAHLALWGDQEPAETTSTGAATATPQADAAELQAGLEGLEAALGALRDASAMLERRLDLAVRVLVGLTAAVVVLAAIVVAMWLA